MADTTQEFGQILPDKRIADIKGTKVDVTRIPARFTLEIMKLRKAKLDEVEAFEAMIDLLTRICQADKPEITKDFLLDKLDVTEIAQLFKYIDEPLTEKAKAMQAQAGEGTEEKNE